MTTQQRNPELVSLLRADFINCWIPLAQSTLVGAVASVTFASLPQNFRALAAMIQARTDRAAEADDVNWRANGDGGNNYDRVYGYWRGDNTHVSGGNVATSSSYCTRAEGANSRASNFGCGVCYWLGYASVTTEKQSITPSTVSFGDASALSDFYILHFGGRWRNTAAITSLTFIPSTGPNFVAGSIFALYGIL